MDFICLNYLITTVFAHKVKAITGLELARGPGGPGTRRNSEHHLWHPRILRFLILTGTRKAHSMQKVAPSVSNS